MFPVPGDEVYYNEAGEILGWDRPAREEDFYCDDCCYSHRGPCIDDYDEDEDE